MCWSNVYEEKCIGFHFVLWAFPCSPDFGREREWGGGLTLYNKSGISKSGPWAGLRWPHFEFDSGLFLAPWNKHKSNIYGTNQGFIFPSKKCCNNCITVGFFFLLAALLPYVTWFYSKYKGGSKSHRTNDIIIPTYPVLKSKLLLLLIDHYFVALSKDSESRSF